MSLTRGELARRRRPRRLRGVRAAAALPDAGRRRRSWRLAPSSSTGRCCRGSSAAACGARPTSRAATRSASSPTRSPCSGLVLVFRDRLWMAAAGWGILAVGDGMAGLVGQATGGPRLPWNARKGWSGSRPSSLFGSAGRGLPRARGSLRLPLAPRRRRTGRARSRVALALAARLRARRVAADDARRQRHGAARDGPRAAAARRGRARRCSSSDPGLRAAPAGRPRAQRRDRAGGLPGALDRRWPARVSAVVIGTAITAGLGLAGLALMIAFFVLGTRGHEARLPPKAARGIAQEKGGARGWQNAWANGGVPAALAVARRDGAAGAARPARRSPTRRRSRPRPPTPARPRSARPTAGARS